MPRHRRRRASSHLTPPPETVTITPEKAGTYEFKCAKFCGMGHSRMKGEIVVSP